MMLIKRDYKLKKELAVMNNLEIDWKESNTGKIMRLKLLKVAFLMVLVFFQNTEVYCEETMMVFPVEGKLKKHTVLAGEDLYTIGLKYHVAIDHIMMANNINSLSVAPGTVLIIPSMRIVPALLETGLVLNLPERMIYLFDSGNFIGWFPVAIGAPGKWMTPVNEMTVVNKTKNPTWLPPEWANIEKPVGPGPDNPLGDRWIGLSMPGYGIHATNSLLSIGMAASHGCIRMHPRDAKELYDKVKIGMPVKIIYEPILIGQLKESDVFYVSVFPDIYNKIPDMRSYLENKLQKYEIEPFIDNNVLEGILSGRKGVLQPVLGADIALKINDKAVRLSFPLLMIGKRIMVTSEILPLLGAGIKWNEQDKIIEVTRNDKRIEFSADKENNENSVVIWKGKAILPLREITEGLGFGLKWEPENRSISILGIKQNGKDSQISTIEKAGKDIEVRIRSTEERF